MNENPIGHYTTQTISLLDGLLTVESKATGYVAKLGWKYRTGKPMEATGEGASISEALNELEMMAYELLG